MNAVTGVTMAGANKVGYLCAAHWSALSGQPGLTFFRIPKSRHTCNVCRQTKKG